MSLTSSQHRAGSQCLNFLNHAKHQQHQLIGCPGTGKSFLTKKIAEDYAKPLLILAPTHEALGNVREKVGNLPNITYATVAAATGLTASSTSNGTEFTYKDYSPEVQKLWGSCSAAIIDEISMVSEAAWNHLVAKSRGKKLLVVGDDAQLPEVKPRIATDKCQSHFETLMLPSSELLEPVRTSNKQLWEFQSYLRQSTKTGNLVVPSTFDINAFDLRDHLTDKRTLESFQRGESKFICWRNSTVAEKNQLIRKSLYGADAPRFVVGEQLVVDRPCWGYRGKIKLTGALSKPPADSEFLHTNQKLTVTRVESVIVLVGGIPACPKQEIECWKLFVGDFFVLVPKNTLTELINSINLSGNFKYRDSLLTAFAQVEYFYAGTAHTFQGSSIPNVIVTLGDMDSRNPYERAKLIYVAMSRVVYDLKVTRGK